MQWIVNVVVHSVHKNTSRNVTGEQQQVKHQEGEEHEKTIAGGVWRPVMITPFTEDNKIDYDAVLRIIEWYDKNGVDGIFAVCQSSEMFELSPQERSGACKIYYQQYTKAYGSYRFPDIALRR